MRVSVNSMKKNVTAIGRELVENRLRPVLNFKTENMTRLVFDGFNDSWKFEQVYFFNNCITFLL